MIVSSKLACSSTPGMGRRSLTGVRTRSPASIAVSPTSTSFPLSAGAGFPSSRSAAEIVRNDGRSSLGTICFRKSISAIAGEKLSPADTCFAPGRPRVLRNASPIPTPFSVVLSCACVATRSTSKAMASRGPVVASSCTGRLRQIPSGPVMACTCPMPAAASAKTGNGSTHNLS